MNEQAVSAADVERTRKTGARITSDILRRLALVTQERAADCMSVDPSTISRMKGESLEKFCQLLAACGLQVAPGDAVVVSQDDIKALERMAYKYLQSKIEHDDGI